MYIFFNKIKHLIQLNLFICFAVTALLGFAPSIVANVAIGSKHQTDITVLMTLLSQFSDFISLPYLCFCYITSYSQINISVVLSQ